MEVKLKNSDSEVKLANGVKVRLLAASGARVYTSVFLHFRFHNARLLFTGDSKFAYEKDLLNMFGKQSFRADVLKVTHHGSSTGTAKDFVKAVQQGIAIASTTKDPDHRLEKDVVKRLGGLGRPRRVFETAVHGDIILRTDGKRYGSGVLFEVDFTKKARLFAADLGAGVAP